MHRPDTLKQSILLNLTQRFCLFVVSLLTIVLLAVSTDKASAHEIAPLVATASLDAALTEVDLLIEANLEALITKIGGDHEDTDDSPQAEEYNRLRALDADALRIELADALPKIKRAINLSADGKRIKLDAVNSEIPGVGDTSLARLSKIRLTGSLPESPKQLNWQFDKAYGASVIRVELPGVERVAEWLDDGKPSQAFMLEDIKPKGFVGTVIDYLRIGFLHIVPLGADHILFVIGLFLLSPFLRPLLWQVSAFTLAHTITIALGTLGYINAPSHYVEPLIAASIILIALENLMTTKVSWWRTIVVFLFGLLHGLGFAGVLGEIGLPDSQFITALISFNVGVEIGQILVLLICFALIGWWSRSKSFYRWLIRIPGSLLIAVIAGYWFLERTVLA